MKKLKLFGGLLAVVALLASSFAFNAEAAPEWNASGSYVINMEYSSIQYPHDMTLSQDGTGNLTGNGGSPAGGNVYTWVITSGTVSGDDIEFFANYTATPDAVTPQTVLHVEGTIAPNGTISGTWDDNYQEGSRGGAVTTVTGAATEITNTTVVVSGDTAAGNNLPGWLFNRDTTTDTPFEFNTDEASIGTGSLYVLPIGATAADKFIGENFINASIADVDSISYDFQIGAGGDANDEEQFYMNVYANFGSSADDKFYDCRYDVVPTVGSTSGFTTVSFDPAKAYPVTTRGGTTPSPFTCPSIPRDMDDLSAGSNIRAFALNVGDTSTSDVGLDGYLDNVITVLGAAATTYDFEPAPVTHTIVASAGANGSISPSGSVIVSSGNDQTFTITANSGYHIDDVIVDSVSVGAVSSYTFNDVSANHTISATFELNEVADAPESKDDCKNGGWKNFTNPSFKNQGQCVSSTNH